MRPSTAIVLLAAAVCLLPDPASGLAPLRSRAQELQSTPLKEPSSLDTGARRRNRGGFTYISYNSNSQSSGGLSEWATVWIVLFVLLLIMIAICFDTEGALLLFLICNQ